MNAHRDKSALALAAIADLETDKKKLLTRGGTDRNDARLGSTRLARYTHHRHSFRVSSNTRVISRNY